MFATTLENRELLNFVYELKKLNAPEEIVLAATMFFEQLEHKVDTEDEELISTLETELAEKENENYTLRERISELNLKKNNYTDESLKELKKENQALKEELEELRKFKKVFRYLINEVSK